MHHTRQLPCTSKVIHEKERFLARACPSQSHIFMTFSWLVDRADDMHPVVKLLGYLSVNILCLAAGFTTHVTIMVGVLQVIEDIEQRHQSIQVSSEG